METIIHYEKGCEKHLHEFENKRADFLLQDLAEWPIEDLKAFLRILHDDNRTFATAQA